MIPSNDTEEKFAKAIRRLRALRPFYSAVYESLDKICIESVATMATDGECIYYNNDFIETLSFEEFIFQTLHLIAHLCLQHVSRRGHRDRELWGAACDFYVNSVLAQEFEISPNKPISSNQLVMFDTECLFTTYIDTEIDYVEDMYTELEKQAEANNYLKDKASSARDEKRYKFTLVTKRFRSTGYGCSCNTIIKSFKGVYKGRNENEFELTLDAQSDIMISKIPKELLEQAEKRIMNNAIIRNELMKHNNEAGSIPGSLEFLVTDMLTSKLDWRKYLKSHLIKRLQSESTFSKTDKRMSYRKEIYPGKEFVEENMVKGVKVCIDTSGSISDEDLAYFFGQVYDLTKKYKVEAEIIYWDATVQSTGEFKDFNEFKRVQCSGRGGTQPRVIFEYFESAECKVKPLVVLIFTDGYFGNEYYSPKFAKKYKHTVWIMTRGFDKSFSPLFGVKALAKFNTK